MATRTERTGCGGPTIELIDSSMRPHCRQTDACKAKGAGHCRGCAGAAIHANPEHAARRLEGIRKKYADPDFRAERGDLIKRNVAHLADDPVHKERLRERGRTLQREHVRKTDFHAVVHSPEARAKRGASITERRLGWCPPELRQAYRDFVRCKGLTAAEARAAIEDILAAPAREARRAIAEFDRQQRERHAREQREAY